MQQNELPRHGGDANRFPNKDRPDKALEGRVAEGGRNAGPTAQFRIDWSKVQEAGMGEKGPLRDLAIMLFPTDDCSDYNAKLQAEGWPKATVTMRGEDGKPRTRPDTSLDQRYL